MHADGELQTFRWCIQILNTVQNSPAKGRSTTPKRLKCWKLNQKWSRGWKTLMHRKDQASGAHVIEIDEAGFCRQRAQTHTNISLSFISQERWGHPERNNWKEIQNRQKEILPPKRCNHLVNLLQLRQKPFRGGTCIEYFTYAQRSTIGIL